MQQYEKLGQFYLGRMFDMQQGKPNDELLLYDAKDLTTHAVCVGMTGSGKTGLCLTLLEEAAIDGIPSIMIDPKGDLGNLMLTFPKLRAEDFRPWIDPAEANRKGMTPDEYAANRAQLWKKGLAGWDQDGERIARFRDAAEITIYTPGSTAGVPISVLRSFSAPPPELAADREAVRDRIMASVSGLLALLGIDADPIRSREHILLSTILDHAWRDGRDLDIAGLIGLIQTPPFERIGVMDLESFYKAKDRFTLAMALNNLLASPGFATWMEGEPLDVGNLLYTEQGRPRMSILSISHLSEAERMFFVTILLNEVVAWMRTQPGTGSLRALLYMDEVFGFFPPVANPPSKQPMLTLLKQARAYGLGCVLATQNPVDLDYKGLSNAGTWFLGRLQTEQDKARVMEGLEGASAAAGANFDRKRIDRILSGVSSRVFLMNNVHEDEPVLFHTRWALSYLRGPLTRTQIQELMAPRKALMTDHRAAPRGPAHRRAEAVGTAGAGTTGAPPPLPPAVKQFYLPVAGGLPRDGMITYRPALVGCGRMHFVRVSAKIDSWQEVALLADLDDEVSGNPWEEADVFNDAKPEFERRGDERGSYATLPGAAARADSYKDWSKDFVDHLYRGRAMTIYKCKALKESSLAGESEGEFRIRLRQAAQEARDLQLEKLRKRYTPKLATITDRIRRAEQRVETEEAQYKQSGFQTAISLGGTLLGAVFGRKVASVGTIGRAASTMKGAGRTARQRGDIGRAKETLEAQQVKLQDMEAEFEAEVEKVEDKINVDTMDFEEMIIRPRKGDMRVEKLGLAWAPFLVHDDGRAEPLFDM